MFFHVFKLFLITTNTFILRPCTLKLVRLVRKKEYTSASATLNTRSKWKRLIGRADVMIVNFPPPARERLKLRWADIEPINPRLVYCSLTGYGADGPDADRPGIGALVAARTGHQYEVRGTLGGTISRLSGGPGIMPGVEAPEGVRVGPGDDLRDEAARCEAARRIPLDPDAPDMAKGQLALRLVQQRRGAESRPADDAHAPVPVRHRLRQTGGSMHLTRRGERVIHIENGPSA